MIWSLPFLSTSTLLSTRETLLFKADMCARVVVSWRNMSAVRPWAIGSATMFTLVRKKPLSLLSVNVLPKLHIIRWETKASEVQNAEDLTAEESKTQNLTSESQMAESDKVSVDSKEAIDCKLLCERLTDLREAENVTETQVRGEIGKAWPDAQEAKAYTDTERRDSKSKARPA